MQRAWSAGGFSAVAFVAICLSAALPASAQQQPIHVGFLWHMHQPIYYPYESLIDTDAQNRFSFSVIDVHNQRFGPYTTWPLDAVLAGDTLDHLGAQVSFSGSLIENLNNLEDAGVNGGMWTDWNTAYSQGASLNTTLGHPRLDLVAFGYHHPLMPLLDLQDARMQIRLHKHIYAQTWAGEPVYSHGMFPAETAFSIGMIPALVAEGVEWVLVDNIHFDRACIGYPHTNQSGLFTPNPADQINPDPADADSAWVQLNDLWAPSQVSAPFGYQPHYVQHVNPATGQITRVIAVPAAHYEGNEDGRGGYGAFLYDQVMDQYIQYNTDPAHPMLVILHHDGDNFGGGGEAYYHANFQSMIAWVSGDPDYDITTIEDYLQRFPPDPADVIHVENGAWVGADSGDPEFKKWLGDPGGTGWSPDINSWAVLTAAKNLVFTAEAINPAASMQNVMDGTGTNTEKAWHFLLVSQASDYWYWDGTETWDSNVTRGCNEAVALANLVIAGQPDTTAPTVFLPQREPYNPGGYEWGSSTEPSDFEVWTLAYDLSGLDSVTLLWRTDNDGVNPLDSIQNETYAGGPEVGTWNSAPMPATTLPAPPPGILSSTCRATRHAAMITGLTDTLVDYYVQATDSHGNVHKSAIQHVYVGQGGSGGGDVVVIDPDPAQAGQNVSITYNPGGRPLAGVPQVYLHYGFNGWNPIVSPDPPMTWNDGTSTWQITVPVISSATQLDLVFNDGAGTWDNNNGADWHFAVTGGSPPPQQWVIDGELDAGATLVAANNGQQLYAGVIADTLYVAAPRADSGSDHFIFVADVPGAPRSAPWAKAGLVANWSAFLGNEGDNGWSGWFDTAAATASAAGGCLEGTINLADEFGYVPPTIYLAFGPYGGDNGDPLDPGSQIPATVNGDGTLDAAEYAAYRYLHTGDLDCDGDVDFDDINPFVLALSGEADYAAQYPACHWLNADCDTDGDVDFDDINPFVTLLGN